VKFADWGLRAGSEIPLFLLLHRKSRRGWVYRWGRLNADAFSSPFFYLNIRCCQTKSPRQIHCRGQQKQHQSEQRLRRNAAFEVSVGKKDNLADLHLAWPIFARHYSLVFCPSIYAQSDTFLPHFLTRNGLVNLLADIVCGVKTSMQTYIIKIIC